MAKKNDKKKPTVAKPKKEKVVALRALLIKTDFTDPATILKDTALDEHPLDLALPFSGRLYVKPQEKSVPSWVAFIKPHINGDLSKLKNASTAAVLLVKVDGRTIAFTFGHGRNLLNPEAWERDFGLKVALDTVAVKSLRSVDCRTFEELTLQTRRQLSRASGFDRFGLNVTQDLVRQVTGVPENEAFVRCVAGSDGLMFAAPLGAPIAWS
ncbi:MAG: TIGR04141 family sporadically distributed protein [Tepidisphaeraceae bacterium]